MATSSNSNTSNNTKAIEKHLNRISDEIDIEAGIVNPFTLTLIEIARKEHSVTELDQEDFYRYVDRVNKTKSKHYL